MKRYSINLTIGHNVKNAPMFSTREVCEYVTEYLGIEAFTAMECFGMWQGRAETSTRVEICDLSEAEANAIRANVPILAQALAQDSIMFETRLNSVEFLEAPAIDARKTA